MAETLKQNLIKTISKVGYSILTVSDTKVTAGTVKWLPTFEAGGREYSADPSGDVTEIYADGICVYSQEDNNGYDLKLTLLAVVDDVYKDWYGFDKVTNEAGKTGTVEYANAKTYPKLAICICEDTTNGVGKTTIFYYCNINKRPSRSVKTSEGKFDPQYPQFELVSRPRPTDRLVVWTIEGQEEFTELPEPPIQTQVQTQEGKE